MHAAPPPPHAGFYRLDHGNLDRAVALLLTGMHSHAPDGCDLTPGRVVLPEHYAGPAMTRVAHGTQAPADLADWTIGSLVWNSAPTAGGFIGWVVINDGASGRAWRGFGRIEA